MSYIYKVQGWAEKGNTIVRTSGLPSTNKVQGSFPNCNVTVVIHDTATLATIYSDESATPLANPFTAAADGTFAFYVASGRYDIVFYGGDLPAPVTVYDITPSQPSGPKGVVTMIHTDTYHGASRTYWAVYKPDGTELEVPSSTTTMGLAEAIAYSAANEFNLKVYGGNLNAPGLRSEIIISETVAFPVGFVSDYEFSAVYFVSAITDATLPMFTFDSCDMTRHSWRNSEVLYYGTAACFDFNPQHDNGEGFAGFTESRFELPTIVMLNPNQTFRTNAGIGIRWRSPNLALGLPDGNGLTFQCYLSVQEINSGQVAFQLDNPGSGQSVSWSEFHIKAHGQGDCYIQQGTTTTNSTAIHSNEWHLNCAGAQTGAHAVNLWGGSSTEGGDVWYGNASSPFIGMNLNSTARKNRGYMGVLYAATPVNDVSTTHDNYFESNAPMVRHNAITVPASTVPFQNTTGQLLYVAISGGTVSQITFSTDGSTYDFTSLTTGIFQLFPGQWLKITYSVVPNMAWSY